MEIAAGMCIYTNDQIILYSLDDTSHASDSPVPEPSAEPSAAGPRGRDKASAKANQPISAVES